MKQWCALYASLYSYVVIFWCMRTSVWECVYVHVCTCMYVCVCVCVHMWVQATKITQNGFYITLVLNVFALTPCSSKCLSHWILESPARPSCVVFLLLIRCANQVYRLFQYHDTKKLVMYIYLPNEDVLIKSMQILLRIRSYIAQQGDIKQQNNI